MTLLCRYGGLMIYLIWWLGQPLLARQLPADTKIIQKTFSTIENPTVIVAGVYADIEIKSWDQSNVSVQVEISATANEMETVQTMLDRIGVDFSSDTQQVKIKSQLDEISSWRSELMEGEVLTLVQFADGRKLRLASFTYAYTIYVPEAAFVQVSSRYGHLIMGNHEGPVEVQMSYGRLDAAKLGETSRFKLSHTQARIQELGQSEIETHFGKLRVRKARTIKLTSLHGNNRFDAIESLTSEGRYQTLIIGRVRDFSAVERHSSCALRNLQGSGDLELSFGSLEIERVEEGFKELKIRGEDTHIEVHPAPGATYSLAVHTTGTELGLPDQMDIQDDQLKTSQQSRKLTAIVGSPAKGRLEIYATDGSILLE